LGGAGTANRPVLAAARATSPSASFLPTRLSATRGWTNGAAAIAILSRRSLSAEGSFITSSICSSGVLSSTFGRVAARVDGLLGVVETAPDLRRAKSRTDPDFLGRPDPGRAPPRAIYFAAMVVLCCAFPEQLLEQKRPSPLSREDGLMLLASASNSEPQNSQIFWRRAFTSARRAPSTPEFPCGRVSDCHARVSRSVSSEVLKIISIVKSGSETTGIADRSAVAQARKRRAITSMRSNSPARQSAIRRPSGALKRSNGSAASIR
jgi:hypothetical protein